MSRNAAKTLPIRNVDVGHCTPELDLAIWFDPATRTYHRKRMPGQ